MSNIQQIKFSVLKKPNAQENEMKTYFLKEKEIFGVVIMEPKESD